MATSGLTTFEFEVLDFLEHGYALAGLDSQKLGYGHAKRGREVLQLIFSDWENRHSFPWKQDIVTLPLVAASEYYDLNAASAVGDNATIDILDMVYRPAAGDDIPMMRIALTDYLAIPDKSDQGQPDRYFLRRDLTAPRLFIWQTSGLSSGSLVFYRVKQLFDVTASAQTLDVAKRWSMAVTKRLAYELMPYITPMEKRDTNYQNERSVLRGEMNEAFNYAVEEDRDTATTSVYPEGWASPSLWS